MKGLLLKDFYMMLKYFRLYVFMTVACLVGAYFGQSFFVFYPCLLCGMIPANLLAYDERSRWLQYSGTLPYTKGQIVSGKYLIGLMVQAAVLILTGIVQGLRMQQNGALSVNGFVSLMLMILLMAMISSSISLPFMFKWGVEKGKIAYYVMVGVICPVSMAGANLLDSGLQMEKRMSELLPILCVIGASIYALSWYLSIVLFNKREVV